MRLIDHPVMHDPLAGLPASGTIESISVVWPDGYGHVIIHRVGLGLIRREPRGEDLGVGVESWVTRRDTMIDICPAPSKRLLIERAVLDAAWRCGAPRVQRLRRAPGELTESQVRQVVLGESMYGVTLCGGLVDDPAEYLGGDAVDTHDVIGHVSEHGYVRWDYKPAHRRNASTLAAWRAEDPSLLADGTRSGGYRLPLLPERRGLVEYRLCPPRDAHARRPGKEIACG